MPHPLIGFPGMVPFVQEDVYLTYANDRQLDFVPTFHKLAYDQFESRIRIHSATNTRATSSIDPLKAQRHSKAISAITEITNATRRRRKVQVGHHPLSHRRLCTGCRDEPERL